MKDPGPDADEAHAEELLRRGAYAEAAAELRRIGQKARAQELYERIWDFRSAAELARERGDRPALLRLLLDAGDGQEVHLLHRQLLRAPAAEQEAAAWVYEQRRLWSEAAELREAAGDLPAAQRLYRRARRFLDAGRLCERLDELREAGLAYEQVAEDETATAVDRARARLGLGRVLRRFGRHEDAVRQFQRARRLVGEEPATPEMAELQAEIDRPLADSLRALGHGAVAVRVEARLPRGRTMPQEKVGRDLLLGRYGIVRLLGSGGMGRVYLARDALLQREVAVKIVPLPEAHAAAGYRRFLREARAAAALCHPHIVQVLETHEAEGVIVMEHLPGGTLAGRPLPLTDALARRVLLQLLDALTAAHAAGLIHRDIKPQNIFLTAAADAKLGDFGASHLLDLQATQTAGLVGTLAYMAPEQIAGGPLSFATDIYALGVTAFQMCTGRLPFTGPDLVGQHLGEEPPRPTAVRPGLDPAWDRLCLTALAKAPTDRFASLEDMRRAVQALPRQGSGPGEALPVPPPPPAAEVAGDDPCRVEAALGSTACSALFLGTDTRLGRSVIVEEFAAGLLQGHDGAEHLRWLRQVARAGGPGLQRVLRIDLGRGAARVVYEAPLGPRLSPGEQLGPDETAALRRALRRLHRQGAVHGSVAASVLREEAVPLLVVAGQGPLHWTTRPTPEDDLSELDTISRLGSPTGRNG